MVGGAARNERDAKALALGDLLLHLVQGEPSAGVADFERYSHAQLLPAPSCPEEKRLPAWTWAVTLVWTLQWASPSRGAMSPGLWLA
jgi:hypothetical protein